MKVKQRISPAFYQQKHFSEGNSIISIVCSLID